MKTINLGTKNDATVYAIKVNGKYEPISKIDREFVAPDAKINYDSGIYPGVTHLLQYICNKANNN